MVITCTRQGVCVTRGYLRVINRAIIPKTAFKISTRGHFRFFEIGGLVTHGLCCTYTAQQHVNKFYFTARGLSSEIDAVLKIARCIGSIVRLALACVRKMVSSVPIIGAVASGPIETILSFL